jgi:hypothetical protein
MFKLCKSEFCPDISLSVKMDKLESKRSCVVLFARLEIVLAKTLRLIKLDGVRRLSFEVAIQNAILRELKCKILDENCRQRTSNSHQLNWKGIHYSSIVPIIEFSMNVRIIRKIDKETYINNSKKFQKLESVHL